MTMTGECHDRLARCFVKAVLEYANRHETAPQNLNPAQHRIEQAFRGRVVDHRQVRNCCFQQDLEKYPREGSNL